MNLFLIGYRCTGKTSVGQALAGRLKWTFVDTDRMVVATAGVGIARMVADQGWPHFRERERDALRQVSAGDRQVVATGGGIVLDRRNTVLMKKAGRIVWLTASEGTIAARMRRDAETAGSRPSLTGEGHLAEIAAVLAQRAPLYRDAADQVVDTDGKSIAAICETIVRGLHAGA